MNNWNHIGRTAVGYFHMNKVKEIRFSEILIPVITPILPGSYINTVSYIKYLTCYYLLWQIVHFDDLG